MTLPKSSILLHLSRRARLASGLLVLLGAPLTGCLVPQDDVVFPDLPAAQNHPLQLVGYTPPGQREQTAVVGSPSTTCTPTDFAVTVSDPDVGDTMRSRWYIDRTDTSPPVAGDAALFSTGASTRTVTAPTALRNQLSTLVDGKRHVLEVFVTDGNFSADSPTAAVPRKVGTKRDGGELDDPYYVVSQLWLVQVERCP